MAKRRKRKSKNAALAALAARLRRLGASKKSRRGSRRRGMRGFGANIRLKDGIAPAAVAVTTTVLARVLKRAVSNTDFAKKDWYKNHADAIETGVAAAAVIAGTALIKPLRRYTGTAITVAGTIAGFEGGKLVVDKFLPGKPADAAPAGQKGYTGTADDIIGRADTTDYGTNTGVGMFGPVEHGLDLVAVEGPVIYGMSGLVDEDIARLARAA